PGLLQKIKNGRLLPDESYDIIIDSSVVKLAKPDPAIFRLAESKAGIKGNQILFVENSQTHINIAKKLGWQTFLYDSAKPIISSRKLLERCKTFFN
ncbi:MAG: HAD-IA family hydrolase, partial [bacterium]|nr:HAD-IA family hydrolase [bacterium]